MDFFACQDRARRQTGRLILLFILGLGMTVLCLYVVLAVILGVALSDASAVELPGLPLFGFVAAFMTLIVGGTWLVRTATLRRGGGAAVAAALNGQPISPRTTDMAERRLLNVAEEMSLAAGMPVPVVYILRDEPGINAFAAGWGLPDAVIGVTRGAVDLLNRDELQGVIGHELSHVFNGDMRINIRIIGIIAGLAVVSMLGYGLFRIALRAPPRTSSRDKRDSSGSIVIVILAIGASLWLIGWIGKFFGSLIQAAVSRQREFLADASAAQFTRNPLGLANALKKIGALEQGSRVTHPRAAEISHLFFARGSGSGGFAGWTSTHPPLEKRIQRLDPSFDGDFDACAAQLAIREAARPSRPPASPPPIPALPPLPGFPALPGTATLLDTAGRPTAGHLEESQLRLDRLAGVRSAVSAVEGAKSFILALLGEEPGAAEHNEAMVSARTIAPELRLSAVELALGSLRAMPRQDWSPYLDRVEAAIRADGDITLFEYAVWRMLERTARAQSGRAAAAGGSAGRELSPSEFSAAASSLLSALAWAGQDEKEQAEQAFQAAARMFEAWGMVLEFKPAADAGLFEADVALDALGGSRMEQRRKFLSAAMQCLIHDGRITLHELELYRAIAAALDIPVPPMQTTTPGKFSTRPVR